MGDHRIRYRLRPEQCGEVSRLNAALDRIESLAVVSGHVVFQTEHNKGAGRVHVNLWCRGWPCACKPLGIANRNKRLEELRAKIRPHLKPGNYASVQARERWSTAEAVHLRPGHHWVFELGDAGGDKGCVEKRFKLLRSKWEMYKV